MVGAVPNGVARRRPSREPTIPSLQALALTSALFLPLVAVAYGILRLAFAAIRRIKRAKKRLTGSAVLFTPSLRTAFVAMVLAFAFWLPTGIVREIVATGGHVVRLSGKPTMLVLAEQPTKTIVAAVFETLAAWGGLYGFARFVLAIREDD